MTKKNFFSVCTPYVVNIKSQHLHVLLLKKTYSLIIPPMLIENWVIKILEISGIIFVPLQFLHPISLFIVHTTYKLYLFFSLGLIMSIIILLLLNSFILTCYFMDCYVKSKIYFSSSRAKLYPIFSKGLIAS